MKNHPRKRVFLNISTTDKKEPVKGKINLPNKTQGISTTDKKEPVKGKINLPNKTQGILKSCPVSRSCLDAVRKQSDCEPKLYRLPGKIPPPPPPPPRAN